MGKKIVYLRQGGAPKALVMWRFGEFMLTTHGQGRPVYIGLENGSSTRGVGDHLELTGNLNSHRLGDIESGQPSPRANNRSSGSMAAACAQVKCSLVAIGTILIGGYLTYHFSHLVNNLDLAHDIAKGPVHDTFARSQYYAHLNGSRYQPSLNISTCALEQRSNLAFLDLSSDEIKAMMSLEPSEWIEAIGPAITIDLPDEEYYPLIDTPVGSLPIRGGELEYFANLAISLALGTAGSRSDWINNIKINRTLINNALGDEIRVLVGRSQQLICELLVGHAEGLLSSDLLVDKMETIIDLLVDAFGDGLMEIYKIIASTKEDLSAENHYMPAALIVAFGTLVASGYLKMTIVTVQRAKQQMSNIVKVDLAAIAIGTVVGAYLAGSLYSKVSDVIPDIQAQSFLNADELLARLDNWKAFRKGVDLEWCNHLKEETREVERVESALLKEYCLFLSSTANRVLQTGLTSEALNAIKHYSVKWLDKAEPRLQQNMGKLQNYFGDVLATQLQPFVIILGGMIGGQSSFQLVQS